MVDEESDTGKPRGKGRKAKAAARKAEGSGGGAKAKGGGKGKAKTLKQGGKNSGKLNSKTLELKPICYAYGSKEGCKKAACSTCVPDLLRGPSALSLQQVTNGVTKES